MLKKLKLKYKPKFTSVLFVFLAVCLTAGAFLYPKTSGAVSLSNPVTKNCNDARNGADRHCNLQDISLTTDILVNGQKGNFIRVGNDSSAKIDFTVQVTLNSPDDINMYDRIYFAGAGQGNLTTYKFGSTITPKDTTKICGSNWSTSWLTLGKDFYDKCQSDGDISGTNPGKYDDFSGNLLSKEFIKSGGLVYKHTFSIPQSDFAKLGITSVNNGTDNNSGVNQIYAAPDLLMGYAFSSNDWTTYTKAGKAIFIQLYPDTAAATAAANQPMPNGVPAYGSNTGSGNAINQSDGNGLLGLVNKVIAFLLQIVTEFLYFLFYWLVAPTIQAMLSIHTYTDTFANVIYPGWEVVRNVSNIFFIVALIAIAMGTLFRVESYQFRHLLVQLIIAALLVNFSLVVCQAILAIADTIQNQFLPNNVEVIRSLARDLMVSNIRDVTGNLNFVQFGTLSQTVSLLFYCTMSIASFAVFLAIMVYLVIRIVALWIFMMLSPIAYVARILPSTAQYAGQWWGQFLKYAFFTPIMAFFLNMAAIISSNQARVLQTVSSKDFADSTAPTLSSFVFKVASNIILLVFLFAALKVAEQLGIYGAATITERAQKGWFAPFKAAKWVGSRTFEGIQNTFGVTLSPKQLAEDWKHYSEHKKAERLRNRQAGKGRFNLQGKTGIPTASPMDLYETYANFKGVQRVLRSTLGLRGFRRAAAKAEAAKEKSEIMDDVARLKMKEQETELGKDEAALVALQAGASGPSTYISGVRAGEIEKRLKAKLDDLDALKKQIEAEKTDATNHGETESAQHAQDRLDALQPVRDDLKNKIENLDSQLHSGGPIDVSALMTNEEVKEGVKDQLNQVSSRRADLLKAEKTDDDKRVKHDLGAHGVVGSKAFTPDDKAKAVKEFKHLEEEAMHLKRPEMFYARTARNEAAQEEAKKIQDVDEQEELIRYLKDAIHEENSARVEAILKKLAKDSNFNEALGVMVKAGDVKDEHGNVIGTVKDGETSFLGMRKFFDDLGKKIHMSESHKLQLATEVGYVNEDVNWWDLARVTRVGTKGLQWATHDEHHDAITAEMRKRYPQRQARDFSRIAYVTQKIDPEKGWVSETIHKSGINLLRDFSEEDNFKQFQQNVRVNTARAITSVPNWEDILRKNGVGENVIGSLKKKSQERDRG